MERIEFLRCCPLFHGLDLRALQRIERDFVSRRYIQGDIIFHEGDPGAQLYLIQRGHVRIYVNNNEGGETSVILFGRPGDFFGELAVIDGLPRSATAVALDGTMLLIIGREQFRDQMRLSPRLAFNFMQELTQRVRYNTRQMDSLVSLPVPQRLARKLLELAQNYGRIDPLGILLDISLTQSDLASLIGASRESTNKTLRQFRRQDWLRFRQGRIIVVDPEALRGLMRP